MAGSRELIALFQRAVLESKEGAKAIAADLDKRPSTLYDELNPAPEKTGQGKLGVEDSVEIMRMTGDVRPLEYIAGVLGFTIRHMNDRKPDGKDMDHECLQGLLSVARFIESADKGISYTQASPLLEDAIVELKDVWKRLRTEQPAKGRRVAV